MNSFACMARCGAVTMALVACGGEKEVAPADTARCTECEIALDRVGILSDSFEPGALPDYMVYATRDSAGRVYVISRKNDGVFVFDSAGSLLRRLGRPGPGPGEFRTIRRVLHGARDSVFVTDWGLGRVTVYAPDLTFARAQPIAHQPELVLADGSFIIADDIGTKIRMGYSLHRTTADGTIATSFGVDTPQYRPDLRLLTTRWVAPSRTGTIWAAVPGRYRIEQWDVASGQRTKVIDVKSSWFKQVAAWPAAESVRPPAVIETLWEDDTGIIWILLRDADLDWRAPPTTNAERRMTAEEYETTYDWIVEAVDPASGTVVASRRFRHILWGRAGSTVLVSAKSITTTQSTYDVWAPRLR